LSEFCIDNAYRHQENATDDAKGDDDPTQAEQKQQLSFGLYVKSGFPDDLCALVPWMSF
jgi:hypothetical protein